MASASARSRSSSPGPLATLAFGIYLSVFASYASIFGNLATLFVLIEYLFGVSVIFLAGALLDARLREREG